MSLGIHLMLRLLALLISFTFSIMAQANIFNPADQTLPLSGKMFFVGASEPENPPADTDPGWQEVSGNFNLNAPGWY
jgi:hypothetical protein